MGNKKLEMDQLSIDSSNAIKAGLSYGKYIALYGHSKAQAQHQAPVGYKRNCQFCGKDFYIPTRRAQRFCSDKCRERSYYITAIGPMEKMTCPICGKDFMPNTRHQKYCDRFCAERARRQRVKAKTAAEVNGNG